MNKTCVNCKCKFNGGFFSRRCDWCKSVTCDICGIMGIKDNTCFECSNNKTRSNYNSRN